MLIGTNYMTINTATMCEIVEHYLTNVLLHRDHTSPKVTSVTYDANKLTFEVKLEMAKPE